MAKDVAVIKVDVATLGGEVSGVQRDVATLTRDLTNTRRDVLDATDRGGVCRVAAARTGRAGGCAGRRPGDGASL